MAADGRKKRGFIKLPQTKYRKEENALLAVGLLLVLTGLFVFVGKHEASVRLFAFRPVICLGLGILLLFTSLAFTGSSLSLFFGLFFLQMGAVLLIMDSGILPCGFSQMWPTIMIAAAFSLFPAGLYKARRVRTVYLFPAIMMLLLGITFLLFSFHVFPVSFREFVDFAKEKGTSCIMCHEQPSKEKLQRTGVVEVDEHFRVLSMEEKPLEPKSHWAVPPFYIYKKEDLDLVRHSVENGCGKDAPGNLAHYMVEHTVMHAWPMSAGRFDIGSLDTYYEAVEKYG